MTHYTANVVAYNAQLLSNTSKHVDNGLSFCRCVCILLFMKQCCRRRRDALSFVVNAFDLSNFRRRRFTSSKSITHVDHIHDLTTENNIVFMEIYTTRE